MQTTDPYKAGMFSANPYKAKAPVIANLVVVLGGKLEGRRLSLMKPPSRAVLAGEIHELIFTDEADAGPGSEVNRIAYLGFMEVKQGSVIVAGDKVYLAGKEVGEIAGFDETHMPNHLNILIKTQTRSSGEEMGASLGMEVVISML